jgi:predicted metal-dependent hydrolase
MVLFRPAPRYADGDHIVVAGARVRLRVSSRASRVSLRIDAARREVIATAPNPRRLTEASAFAHARTAWIAAQLADLPEALDLAPGVTIDVLGRPWRLERASGRARWRPATAAQPAALMVSGDGEAFAKAVVRALKAEARRVFTERTAHYAAALDRPVPVLAVMDAKARWGSCKQPRQRGFGASAEVGRVRYSWRLVLAPFEVCDYVVAHECAHLVEANHSPRFWAVVHDLVGDHRPHRDWLRKHGARLHAFGG